MNGKITVQYVIMREGNDWVLRADKPLDMEKARERWRLAFTVGKA